MEKFRFTHVLARIGPLAIMAAAIVLASPASTHAEYIDGKYVNCQDSRNWPACDKMRIAASDCQNKCRAKFKNGSGNLIECQRECLFVRRPNR